MSAHFDSLRDLRKHFETDQGSYASQSFSELVKDELWFRDIQWEYQALRKYLNDQGMTGPLVKNCGGWVYKL